MSRSQRRYSHGLVSCMALRLEVVHGDHPDHGGRERSGNLRIAHVGEVLLTADLQVVDLGVEGFADLPRRAGEVDHHAVGIDVNDGEAVRLKPNRDGVEVFLRQTVLLPLFCRQHPVVEVGRGLVGESVDELLKLLFQLGVAFQLKQHVRHGEVVRYQAAIVLVVGFGTRIAAQPDQVAFVNGLGDKNGQMIVAAVADLLCSSGDYQAGDQKSRSHKANKTRNATIGQRHRGDLHITISTGNKGCPSLTSAVCRNKE